MQLSNTPGKLVLPFADAGGKNTIPAASQIGITPGAASLIDGFPPLTRTPIAAGGVPPSGLDMNGVLYEMSAIDRWTVAGGGYAFDSTFANDLNVGGYPKGARVMRSDGLGYWLSTAENNVTDPESSPVGWAPDTTSGSAAVTMTNVNVTLTPLQYGHSLIVITGTLTANLNLIFPAIAGEWTVANGTSGAFTVTCKTASGTGVVAGQGVATPIYGDGTNIDQVSGTVTATNDATFADNSTRPASTSWVLGGFTVSLAANGHLKLPKWLGGVIFQWGSGTYASGAGASISFPTAFPANCFVVIAGNSGSGANGAWIPAKTLSSFTGVTASGSASNFYLAIGN